MKHRRPWLFQPIEHDLELVHVDDDFDEVNLERLAAHYSRNQRSNQDETTNRYA